MRPSLVILAFVAVAFFSDASAQMMDDFATTDEDDHVEFNITDNDAVFLPQPNTVDLNTSVPGRQSSITTPEGYYSVNREGDVTFEPEDDFFGAATLEYSMNYGFLGLSFGTATIHVTVNSINDKPLARDDDDVIDEDTQIVVKVLANDEDIDDGLNPATIVITDQTGGTFVPNSSGEVTFTPTLNFSGTARAKYTVRDFTGATSNKADIEIRVRSLNDRPVAGDDVAVTDEGVAIKIKILVNDYDVDGDIEPSTVLISNETGGTFVANNNGEVTFTPEDGYSTATANYTVQDDDGLSSDPATITVTINSVNKPPVATNDIVAMDEDGQPFQINVLGNDKDEDGTLNPGTVVISDMVNGSFAANASGVVTYTPPANFFGVATAKYTVADDERAISNQATITVTVNAVNDAPSFDAIANQRVFKNAASKAITITGITPGPLESETLTFKATSSAPAIVPHPTITYNGTANTATLTFKPQPNQSGTATINVVVTDQGLKTFPRNFVIEVVDVEFTSTPITIAVPGQVYEYLITVTDVPETLTIVATQKPTWATLTSTGKNKARLRGTPPANAPLANPVTLQLKDGSVVLDQQQFTISLNRPPTVAAFEVNAQEDTPVPITLEKFENAYSDPDNQPLAEVMITNVPNPDHGTLKLSGATVNVGDRIPVASIPNLAYNPNPDYNGRDTASWKGSDGYSFSQSGANIYLVTSPANDAPVITFIESEHLQYELGSEWPIKLTTGITISDNDNVNLVGAEVRFFNFLEYEPDKELLVFRDTLNIRGEFKPEAGILILSGNSSVANYQAALRAVKYNYVNLDKVKLRTLEVYVTLNDGGSISIPKYRAIDLIYTFKHLDIPSAFSPNGDLTNEAWVIRSPNTTDGTVPYKEAMIRVYNKRGLLVYEAKGFERPWDGTFGGKDLPVDTYYYTIDLHYNRVRYKGVVTILR